MSKMHYIRTAANGEPSLWWSWQDLRNRDGEGPKPTGVCTHGRARLHSSSNGVRVEWHLFSRSCGASVAFSSTGDEAITVGLSLPLLFAVYLSLDKARWVERLPGVRYVAGDYNSGEREIRVAIHDGALWWALWINTLGMRHDTWRDSNFNFLDALLGRPKYSESPRIPYDVFIQMPEGNYPAQVEMYTSIWKRPRWPWATRVRRANIEVEGGIPIPGDGDNDWDNDDDAIYGLTCPSGTAWEAMDVIRESALRTRRRNDGEDWAPAAGWPAHCVKRVA